MRYNLPTLLALCQDTGVHCKWTSEARHCRRARPDQSKKPILSENPRNRPTRESARSSRPNKNPALKPSKNRPTRNNNKTFEPVFSTRDAGFAQFLKKHTSPKHQRVTAGGRIVPMEPPRSPRLDGPSAAPTAEANDEPIVSHVFVDDQLRTGGQNGAQENLTIIRSSTASDNNLHESRSPLPASTSHFAVTTDSRNLSVSQAMEANIPYAEHFEYQPLDEDDSSFEDDQDFGGVARRSPTEVQHYETIPEAQERRLRWYYIEALINFQDFAIAQMMSFASPVDILPGCDFYVQYVRVAWTYGLGSMFEARERLMGKLRYHEMYLEELNEFIAMDPVIPAGDTCYRLRVYNTNERARVLNALDHYQMLAEATLTNTVNNSGDATVEPAHQDEPGRTMHDGSHGNLSTDGTNEVVRPKISRGVDIIDPNTGHPIQFQREQSTATNNIRNGTGHTNRNNPDFGNMQVDGSSELLIRDHGNGNRNRSRSNSLFDQIPVDRRSDLFHEASGASGNLPAGSNDPLFDTNNRLDIHIDPGMGSETENNETIAWIPQETWTERRPRNGRRVSNTLPRNFGRNINNLRSALHSITEINHEEHAIELTRTAENDESHTPDLAFSVDDPNGLHFLQNEHRNASVSSVFDDDPQTIRVSSPGPEVNEEILSELSFDRQHGSSEVSDFQTPLIPSDFFDVLVVDVEGSRERRGRPSTQQSEDGMNHSYSGSFTMTMSSFEADYPDDMSDTPLLSRNSPFGRYSHLSRNSPSRAISRSSVRRRSHVPVGGLSSVGSRMISSSLNARRRHDARQNVRNARRSRTSRLIDDLRDEVPATIVLGFDAPDTQQHTGYLPVYSSRLINASVRHTAPAIVNMSRINAHAHN
ncbi:hypothetical protein E8E15_008607 [Penicillium rubens]|uniref:Pc21g06370 protein n=2 Tax=Penicillium chrysogenum species complex TaxID=254878 RepID=B6HIY0_PENRW|nr:uncharacterized protein N7525_007108 [Penicillium rubens]KAF3028122.1 hypothetical protein E8E15_008607 [Penicillium rubens]KAJ5828855.1 hypothetical protein N7525_007108 [Penicillium rubens]KZN88394.1 hypothetical protein EN45_069660 [Penicillium chrysogenum]CAP95534.1 Pc21g06370 [Penicillium rubens Wisconsin 54-1255]